MSFKPMLAAVALLSTASSLAFADPHIMIHDAYALSAGKHAKAGAAFMTIMNHGDEEDRLLSVSSDAAKRVELHTHQDQGNGVMRMMEVEEGFVIPANGSHALARGADHVMFMGLNAPWEQGDALNVIFTFEKAGEKQVVIPVDLTRKDGEAGGEHSEHKHDH